MNQTEAVPPRRIMSLSMREALVTFLTDKNDELLKEREYWGMTMDEVITFILKEGLLQVKGMREMAQAWDRKQEGKE